MLSVINRGTQTSEAEGIPFKVIDGYASDRSTIKLGGVESPLIVDLPITIKQGYMTASGLITSAQNSMVVNLQPIIKSGYTPKTVTPQEN